MERKILVVIYDNRIIDAKDITEGFTIDCGTSIPVVGTYEQVYNIVTKVYNIIEGLELLTSLEE